MDNFKEYKKEDIIKTLSEAQDSFDDFETQVQSDELVPEFGLDGDFTLSEDPNGDQYIIMNAFTQNPTIIPVSSIKSA